MSKGANSDWSFVDPLNALGGKPVAIQGIVGRDDPKATMSRMRFTGRRKIRGTRWPCLALSAVRRYRRHWLPLASAGKHNSSLGRENYFASRGDKFQLTFMKFSGHACVGPRDLSDRPESQALNSRVSSFVFLILNAASEIQNYKNRRGGSNRAIRKSITIPLAHKLFKGVETHAAHGQCVSVKLLQRKRITQSSLRVFSAT